MGPAGSVQGSAAFGTGRWTAVLPGLPMTQLYTMRMAPTGGVQHGGTLLPARPGVPAPYSRTAPTQPGPAAVHVGRNGDIEREIQVQVGKASFLSGHTCSLCPVPLFTSAREPIFTPLPLQLWVPGTGRTDGCGTYLLT